MEKDEIKPQSELSLKLSSGILEILGNEKKTPKEIMEEIEKRKLLTKEVAFENAVYEKLRQMEKDNLIRLRVLNGTLKVFYKWKS